MPNQNSPNQVWIASDELAMHSSQIPLTESCRQVQAIVKFLKPQAVFLELCRSRASILSRKNFKMASKLSVLPGTEFRVAYEEAIKYGGKIIVGDRSIKLKEIEDRGMHTLIMQQMNKEFPILMETLVHERDRTGFLLEGVLDMVLIFTSSAYSSQPDYLKFNMMEAWTFYP
ncbi:hypothetical protein V8G54_024143 [Vigna mungo]|uniref:Uncharacterized protein n=1 Tax=Vigna mungo TaxID=3915 RepID=A0AAQ3N6B1_VIGMU